MPPDRGHEPIVSSRKPLLIRLDLNNPKHRGSGFTDYTPVISTHTNDRRALILVDKINTLTIVLLGLAASGSKQCQTTRWQTMQRRSAIRKKSTIFLASALLAVGTIAGAGAGPVEAAASLCSRGNGPTWTSSVCGRLDNGTRQRAAQYCSNRGWMYGLAKSTPWATSATHDCYATISNRQQIIW